MRKKIGKNGQRRGRKNSALMKRFWEERKVGKEVRPFLAQVYRSLTGHNR